jgi:hypothetical protein
MAGPCEFKGIDIGLAGKEAMALGATWDFEVLSTV